MEYLILEKWDEENAEWEKLWEGLLMAFEAAGKGRNGEDWTMEGKSDLALLEEAGIWDSEDEGQWRARREKREWVNPPDIFEKGEEERPPLPDPPLEEVVNRLKGHYNTLTRLKDKGTKQKKIDSYLSAMDKAFSDVSTACLSKAREVLIQEHVADKFREMPDKEKPLELLEAELVVLRECLKKMDDATDKEGNKLTPTRQSRRILTTKIRHHKRLIEEKKEKCSAVGAKQN